MKVEWFLCGLLMVVNFEFYEFIFSPNLLLFQC